MVIYIAMTEKITKYNFGELRHRAGWGVVINQKYLHTHMGYTH